MLKVFLLLAFSVLGSTAVAGLVCPAKNPGCGIHNKVELKAPDIAGAFVKDLTTLIVLPR